MKQKKNLSNFGPKLKNTFIIRPYDLVFQEFTKLGIDKRDNAWVVSHVSELITQLRANTWNAYLPLEKEFIEKEFTISILQDLVKQDGTAELTKADGITAISNFIEKYPDHIYKSNTIEHKQS